jgi:hypothetical protein
MAKAKVKRRRAKTKRGAPSLLSFNFFPLTPQTGKLTHANFASQASRLNSNSKTGLPAPEAEAAASFPGGSVPVSLRLLQPLWETFTLLAMTYVNKG